MSKRIAFWLRRIADRMDYDGAPKMMSYSFTYERGHGIRFRDDHRGCPIYFATSAEYDRAHYEADLPA